MHDILGGSTPSGRIVAGIISTTQINGIPFSKTNGGIFPINNGVPLITPNNGVINNKGIINNNNLPFVAGLTGASTTTVVTNNGNNLIGNSNSLPFVTAGQLPSGSTLQKLMFGTITVVDDQLTEGHELGSSVIGKAQGFHLASSLDGSSHTMAFTALFHNGDHGEEDTLSFFGVHRTAAHESLIAVVGGTGKYENARGYAAVETIHLTNQHLTDGVDTVLQFSVYLSH
ncbi:dirigent protein 9-like [Carica papaya]|uniref:dirigent protein 9-like n=1 Tax=Carica papaya TaxID=3649 RepID=UPI000B8D182D|nr:dirigent protein 9-like [Carica papaya]